MGVYFCGLAAIFCVLRELIFCDDWFFLLGINFRDFHKVCMPIPSTDNVFVFIEYVQYKYINYFQTNTVNSLYCGHCRDLELVSSLAGVRNSESLFQSNICSLFLPGI